MTNYTNMASPREDFFVGRSIQQRRKALGITQGQLASRVGISARTLWRIENDPNYSPAWDAVVSLARHLDIDMSDLSGVRTAQIYRMTEDEMAELEEVQVERLPSEFTDFPDPDRLDRIERFLARLDGRMERIEHALVDIASGLREESEEGGSVYGAA